MSKPFDILLKLGTIAILLPVVWTTQPHNYYVFLHWFIFLSSIYFAYRTKDIVGIYGIGFNLIFFSAASILFNPFLPFTFQKTTWRIIDIVLIADLILFLDLREYVKSLSEKGKIIFKLIKPIFICLVVWLALCLFIFYPAVIHSIHKYLLFTKEKVTTKGIVTDVYGESSSESDTEPGVRYSYSFSYSFTTIGGEKINSSANVDDKVPDGYKDLSQPYPIEIIYLKENPEINIPKEQMGETLSASLRTEGNIMGIFLFVFALGASYEVIKRAKKTYIAESKKLTTTSNSADDSVLLKN